MSMEIEIEMPLDTEKKDGKKIILYFPVSQLGSGIFCYRALSYSWKF